jgi:hypothetical protein
MPQMRLADIFHPHDLTLVIVSVSVAILAAYVSLELAGRIRASRGWVRWLWLATGAISLGGGIWSMHFIGMLALILPVPVTYDLPLTAVSFLIPIVFAASAYGCGDCPFGLASRRESANERCQMRTATRGGPATMMTRGHTAAIASTTAGGQRKRPFTESEPAVFTSCRARPRTAPVRSAERVPAAPYAHLRMDKDRVRDAARWLCHGNFIERALRAEVWSCLMPRRPHFATLQQLRRGRSAVRIER